VEVLETPTLDDVILVCPGIGTTRLRSWHSSHMSNEPSSRRSRRTRVPLRLLIKIQDAAESLTGAAAAAELQKIVDYRGVVGNFLLGSLAHLGLARAYALSGDTARARAKYQDFFALWKDADPDIPILKEAKADYAKLR
jgi:hypothetical protein